MPLNGVKSFLQFLQDDVFLLLVAKRDESVSTSVTTFVGNALTV